MEKFTQLGTRSKDGWLGLCGRCTGDVYMSDDYVRVVRPWGVKYYHRSCYTG